MSSTDSRQLLTASEKEKAERLFRAAVSAFCSLVRPSRRDIDQLEDLALSLFDMVSADARRFVAAALGESPYAPPALVLRLANEPVDVAAPVLVRSAALSDFDLMTLISRHGSAHARAIAQRPGLSAGIRHLAGNSLAAEKTAVQLPLADGTRAPPVGEHRRTVTAEETRRKLQAMMRPAGQATRFANNAAKTFNESTGNESAGNESGGVRHYEKLRATALAGVPAFFQTALADALDIKFEHARALTETDTYHYLMLALKALGLEEAQAFLLTAAAFPSHFGHPETIRLFLERYRQLHRQAAIEKVGYWKVDNYSTVSPHAPRQPTGDNVDIAATVPVSRKAS